MWDHKFTIIDLRWGCFASFSVNLEQGGRGGKLKFMIEEGGVELRVKFSHLLIHPCAQEEVAFFLPPRWTLIEKMGKRERENSFNIFEYNQD